MTDQVQLETDDSGRVVLDPSRLEALLTEAYRKGYVDAQTGDQPSDDTVQLVELTE